MNIKDMPTAWKITPSRSAEEQMQNKVKHVRLLHLYSRSFAVNEAIQLSLSLQMNCTIYCA
ncbi:conserved hypothetical protein [Trichinella spiralis]|uniref:hypothetical protein n=1 Tax=Trichinella spiralis TaxID=6334 RepID=UPI0001EFD526|nr:conserved hypothetical protein [Trichinella spiralis]